MEVCLLSHEMILLMIILKLNLYPLHYKTAFAFSILPYPQPFRLASRLAFPAKRLWENYGLNTFRVIAFEWGRSRLSAGDSTSATEDRVAPVP